MFTSSNHKVSRARPWLSDITSGVAALLIALSLGVGGCSDDETTPVEPTPGPNPALLESVTLEIGPIQGLTTVWHKAPSSTAIPLGKTVQFRLTCPGDCEVKWTGAENVHRMPAGDCAYEYSQCPMQVVGDARTTARITAPNGDYCDISCAFKVTDFNPADIRISNLVAEVEQLGITYQSKYGEIFPYFGGESIAPIRQVNDKRFRTSVNRTVVFSADVEPVEFSPLLEWRVDGEPISLGSSLTIGYSMSAEPNVTPADDKVFKDLPGGPDIRGFERRDVVLWNKVGVLPVQLGTTSNPLNLELERYSTTIYTYYNDQRSVPDGDYAMFQAVTHPPGYESEVVWIATTRFGTVTPVLATGQLLTATFVDYDDGYPIWLGVKANETEFQQGRK
ncbi:MAG TPA: hypothetical protein VLB27_07485 [candidate division Zixibacteria bacterium]|nr:hypothetical protein [candidate division Zixibacteria bacterium]